MHVIFDLQSRLCAALLGIDLKCILSTGHNRLETLSAAVELIFIRVREGSCHGVEDVRGVLWLKLSLALSTSETKLEV